MESWKGKVGVITGVSSGIGRAIALALLKRGIHVAGLSRRLEKMNELKSELNDADTDGTFLPIQCDVTKKSDVKNALEIVAKSFGSLNILINNAGVAKRVELKSMDVDDARIIYETNVLAVIAVTTEALLHMDPEGIIININSISGHYSETLVGYAAYSGSKRASVGLTRALKTELVHKGSKIRVTSISPGAVRSEMTEHGGLSPKIPMLEVEDTADCVIFVLSLPSRVNISELIIEPRDFSSLKIVPRVVS